MEIELTKLIERDDIPNDARITLEKIRISYKSLIEEIARIKTQFKDFIKDSPAGILEVDVVRGQFISVNEIICKRTGYTKEELLALNPFDLLPEESKEYFAEKQISLLSDKETISRRAEFKVRKKDSSLLWVTARMKFTFDNQGNVESVLMVLSDITDQKRAEMALKESEERYRRLSEAAFEGIVIHDQGIIIEANQTYAKLLGYELSEIIGSNGLNHAAPEFRELILQNILSGSEEPYEAIALRKDGSTFPVEIRAKMVDYQGKHARITTFRDLTHQKKAEEALRESEEKYRTILESIEDSYYEVDLAGNFIFFNKNLCNILGYTESEILGMNYRQYCSEATASQVFKTFNGVYRSNKPIKGLEFEFIRKKGTIGYTEVSVSLIVDSTGKKCGFRGIIREISERKAAEIALQQAKEKYQMLIEKMEEGVVVEDMNGYFTFVNPKTATLLGYKEEELLNKHWSNFIIPECLEMVEKETDKRPEGVSSRYETIALGKSGKNIPLIISATPLHSNEGEFEGVLSVFTDITKLKNTEQKLRKSEKRVQRIKLEEERYHAMSSHFLNNDLQKILFALDLLLSRYNSTKELDHEIIKQLIRIVHHSSRNIELVNKIFAVLQSGLPQKAEKLNALELINNTVEKFTALSNLKIIEVNEKTLSNIKLEVDNYLYDMFYELLFFILNSSYVDLDTKRLKLPVLIEASFLPSNLCISIRDHYSQPISQLISTHLTSPITEKWESRGHYLPIALASVIMKRYNGTLKIIPLDPKGNEFQFLFPLKIIQHHMNI
ncbi:MAG: PAS domain S-box protein [Candidatus Hodarchaeota archaeon]